MDLPRNRTLAGLRRLLDDPDTAVQVVSYTTYDGTDIGDYGRIKVGVNYWPKRPNNGQLLGFINTSQTISYLWPTSWKYEMTEDGILATRQSHETGSILTLLLHQPEVLAQNYTDSLTPDRIDDNA